ncbi:hypothetical protein BV898_12725 [Hypsibius exemplaris]|uniref:RING-type domain-containing protein n=1 Tax=Hypsibius exemplaris TaxID=2072580 RepID=A0A1W0WD22_HYPEX|nr:hypothetical protein BV898_12725 [Hypsibius exemplaris]
MVINMANEIQASPASNSAPDTLSAQPMSPFSCPGCMQPYGYRARDRSDWTVPLIMKHCNHNMCLGCVDRRIYEAEHPMPDPNADEDVPLPLPSSLFKCAQCKQPQTTKVLGELYRKDRPLIEVEIMRFYPVDVGLIGWLVVRDSEKYVAESEEVPVSVRHRELQPVRVDFPNAFERCQRETKTNGPPCTSCHRSCSRVQCPICRGTFCIDCMDQHDPACYRGRTVPHYNYFNYNGVLLDVPGRCSVHNGAELTYLATDTGQQCCIECADSRTGGHVVDQLQWNTGTLQNLPLTTRFSGEVIQRTLASLNLIDTATARLQEAYVDDSDGYFLYFSKLKSSLTNLCADAVQRLAICDGKRIGFLQATRNALEVQLARLRCLERRVRYFTQQGEMADVVGLEAELNGICLEVAKYGRWDPELLRQGRLPTEVLEGMMVTGDMVGDLRSLLDVVDIAVGITDLDIKQQLDLKLRDE